MDEHDMTPMENVRVGQTWAYYDPITDGLDALPMYVKVLSEDGEGAWICLASYKDVELPSSIYFVEGDRKSWELVSDVGE